jgi:Yip1 domain
MNIITRVHGLLTDPVREWTGIEKEPDDAAHVLTSYVAVLALVPAIFGFVGACIVGVATPGGAVQRVPVFEALFGSVFGYVMTCATVLALAVAINLAAPVFGGRRDFDCAFKLVVYSYTPVWLAGVFLVAPGLRFLGLAGFYGAYLLWCGLRPLMQSPPPTARVYAATIVVGALALTVVVAVAQHTLFGI